jgi:hypothetical protein
MKRSEWLEEVAQGCQFASPVEGGSMCKESKQLNYCEFTRCPKIEMEIKE